MTCQAAAFRVRKTMYDADAAPNETLDLPDAAVGIQVPHLAQTATEIPRTGSASSFAISWTNLSARKLIRGTLRRALR